MAPLAKGISINDDLFRTIKIFRSGEFETTATGYSVLNLREKPQPEDSETDRLNHSSVRNELTT